MWAYLAGLGFDRGVQLAIAIGTILAAFATSASVIYSLAQTRRMTRADLKIYCTISPEGYAASKDKQTGEVLYEYKDTLRVQVVNRSMRTVSIAAIGWRTGQPFKREFLPEKLTRGDKFPARLEPYEYATFIAFAPMDTWSPRLKRQLTATWPLRKPSFRIVVQTTLGEKFAERVPPHIYKRITG